MTETVASLPSAALLRINQLTLEGASVTPICFYCPNVACLKACEEKTIYRDTKDTMVVNFEKCTACDECVKTCS